MPNVKTDVKNNVIASKEKTGSGKKVSSAKSVADDVIGSNIRENVVIAAPKNNDERKLTVAIHSTKNVIWEGVGKVEKGYNIVSKAESEKWLTRSHVRLATPEEIAKEYGV